MKFTYPSELPVSASRDRIEQAIKSSQVVIVSGQTGSGKTTQIPKILLQMGRGSHGHQIVHTQPRRIAARTVAERIADELGVKLGDEVGYQVRFEDESSRSTRLRVVTDGILLAQIQRDPKLSAYDTIVIDEAHERSLNIDFLLGYLTALLPQRRDLKLVITSATIDSVKFQEHFAKALHTKVPVIEVSGRTYPVQTVYEPLGAPPALMSQVPGFAAPRVAPDSGDPLETAEADLPGAVARACAELVILSSHATGPRDILVFAAGEHDIHEYEAALRRHWGPRASDQRRPDAIEILPLYARLSAKEQHRAFQPHTHQRIIIATNVAETSLTVPGIRYVVDPGLARISRYSKSAKVQRLPIEPISQASADQRAGRCGRVADGIAIRLYSREDYESRPRFTDPEILRTSLGAVVLHMLSVGVAHTAQDVTGFGFIDPPDVKAVSDGFNELTELGAIDRDHGRIRLNRLGRRLSRIPIDIRLGRMILQADREATPNTLAAVIVVVAFLSLQDPRERPEDKRDEADRLHARFQDPSSDFVTVLNLWEHCFPDGKASSSTLRRLSKNEFLSFPRLRQWHDLYRQLDQTCQDMRMKVGQPRPASGPKSEALALPLAQQGRGSLACSWDGEGLHRCMLSGLLSSLGMQVVTEPKASQFAGLKGAARAKAIKRAQKRSRNEYRGARGTRFAIFPSSALAKTPPPWIMAAGLVETSRLWARYCAAVDPAWAESLAGDLTRVTYAEPHWSATKGAAVASSTVLLYGLPIVSGRPVLWGSINPSEARDFLIRQGLVEGDIRERFSYDDFIEGNRRVLQEEGEQASKTRLVAQSATDEDLYDFYNERLPQEATSLAALAKWWKGARAKDPDMLTFDPTQVERLRQGESSARPGDYPDHWHTVGTDGSPIDLRLSYVYDPQSPEDGVTLHVPLAALGQLTPEQFTWNVPGLLDELIVATIKSLPKALRRQFVPAPDTARAIRAWIDERYPRLPGSAPLDPAQEPPTESDAKPIAAPWPPFDQVFTQAAIDVVGAQVHPQVFSPEQLDRLPPYLRMTFAVEEPTQTGRGGHGNHDRHGRRPGQRSGAPQGKVLGRSKSLGDLQRRFAEPARRSAQARVSTQARKAARQGQVVKRADLLQRSGATTIPRSDMLWQGALKTLKLPDERISSRWLSREALMLAAAPYPSTKALVDDLQLAAVKRLLPRVADLPDDQALTEAVYKISGVFEDTVYRLAQDIIVILQRYAEVDKAVSGPADLPMLSVLQWIRDHAASLVHTGFIGAAPPQALPSFERYLHADLIRLTKARVDKDRDVRWAWQADEAKQLVDKARARADGLPAGPRREEMAEQTDRARWMLEDFYVSLWAQELGAPRPVSIQRIRKALEA
ncbi:ATP-dependent helicase HrpA [Bifidobacterium actinocoloniiforme DSM 22766]|uniref:ATP-dependent helicase HrpA n=1 Tax=Bifidobacterium actinocoloniiforme DSM 22766 TaxID=1437605 RepID=A0A086YZQ4_9BIFI|nr:ATP-dependent RNA helicase HrpA [Bifidobacterium actinocoloniiforme]AKV55058.1 ATP-dependent helicase [Bifidobacterium actinocoloniiforme DSM 22766]KFI39754.1 ATP-dependent helicase HrpA [Bifidobacterium actinocoloniiforme DSM 22766]